MCLGTEEASQLACSRGVGCRRHTLPFRTTTDGLALVRPGPKAKPAIFEIWAGGTWIRREGEKEGQRHQQHQYQCHHNH